MTEFRFRAVAAHSGQAMAVEVFMEDGTHGFTPRSDGHEFVVRSPSEAPQFWYAMALGRRIAFGQSAGGRVTIRVHPDHADVVEQTRGAESGAVALVGQS